MRPPAAVLLDLDGTVYQEAALIPGAPEAIARLRAAGVRVRFVTNTTRLPRSALRDKLVAFGIPADVADVQTAPAAAAGWLRHGGIRRIALYVAEATREDFEGFALDDAAPEGVVIGDLGADWTYQRLNGAFRQVLGGARLIALQRNRYWQTAGGLALDAGPFVAALEYATGTPATLVGKPSRPFFEAAVLALGCAPGDVVAVGDDVTTDVVGARGIGCRGVLVRTGKYRAGDEAASDARPDAVVDSVADLPGLFEI